MSDRRQLNLDRDRVTVLLLINSLLIKKAYSIYAGVLSNQQTLQQMLPQNRQTAFEQFNNVNRRLQCNLGVLLYISDLYHNKGAAQQPNRFQFPVILSTPPEMPELRHLYKRLQDLYPEAILFLKSKMQTMKLQQDQNGMQVGSPQPSGMTSKSSQLMQQQQQRQQQQMRMLGLLQSQLTRSYQQQLNASPFNYNDMNLINSPNSFESNFIGMPQLSRGQMGNSAKMYDSSQI